MRLWVLNPLLTVLAEATPRARSTRNQVCFDTTTEDIVIGW
jgi:hypothetical protein